MDVYLTINSQLSMLAQRLIVSIILIPLGVGLIYAGGWVFAVLVAVVLSLAVMEYWNLFRQGGYHPSGMVLVCSVIALALARYFFAFKGSDLILGLTIVTTMAVQVIAFEKGNANAALDFNITLGGVFYLGWLGSYLVSLRTLPDGVWWFLVVLPATWFGDAGAYFIGSQFGKHKMSPRVSPNKSWEGYAGEVISAALGGMLMAALWHLRAPAVTPVAGLILGLAVGILTPLGDLGESMLKRGFGVKDTGTALPGHGGILDRIDSWLWAAMIGYYIILLAWS